jgi:catechol 2,3-dioxygenase-like lactoylglutathione lyase family enzyme
VNSAEHLLAKTHIRIARPTNDFDSVLKFYRDGLGFELLGEFEGHEGFDGKMLGHKIAAYHLEFTRKSGKIVNRCPSEDNLLVFYVADTSAWQELLVRMESHGYAAVTSFNPYWDRHGKTFEDPDGYRIVLQNVESPV